MKYMPLFKCVLCGNTSVPDDGQPIEIEGRSLNDVMCEAYIKNDVVYLSDGTKIVAHVKQYGTHVCEDGRCGLVQFAGATICDEGCKT